MAAITYDPEADAVSIIFACGPSEGEEVHPVIAASVALQDFKELRH